MPPTPEAYRRIVGARIRASRRDAGYATQAAFADAVGVTDASVSMWESGSTMPALTQQFKIADLVGCPHSELFGLDEAVA